MTDWESSRRGFLRGLAGAGLVVAAPTSLYALGDMNRLLLPMLYGDGVSDDTAALQAMFRGDPFNVSPECRATVRCAKNFIDIDLQRGVYLLSNTLFFAHGETRISNGTLMATRPLETMLQLNFKSDVFINHTNIYSEPPK